MRSWEERAKSMFRKRAIHFAEDLRFSKENSDFPIKTYQKGQFSSTLGKNMAE